MPDLKSMFSQIDALESEIVALVRDLVRIPSVNTGFMPTGDETVVCEFVRDWLAEDVITSEVLGRVPESVRLTCDVRTLPNQDDAYLRRELDGIVEGISSISYEIDYMAVPNSSEFDTELAEHIKAATALALGRDDVQWVPAISTGFTDSRFTRPLGTVTYGFSGSHPDDDPGLSRAHGTDESVGIKSLVSGTKIMLALACSICGAE